jgi:hypothetical protein
MKQIHVFFSGHLEQLKEMADLVKKVVSPERSGVEV